MHVINPIQSNALRGLYIRQSKNDAKDSFIIVGVIRIGRYNESVLSVLTRQRFYLVDMIFDTFGETSLKLLETYIKPEEILAVLKDDLCKVSSEASKGRFIYEKAEHIKNVAKNTFDTLLGNDSCAFMLKQFVEQIGFLENQLKDLKNEI